MQSLAGCLLNCNLRRALIVWDTEAYSPISEKCACILIQDSLELPYTQTTSQMFFFFLFFQRVPLVEIGGKSTFNTKESPQDQNPGW